MKVLASFATMPGREAAAANVIAAIEPQVDQLHVHRNTADKNLGDTAKFLPCWNLDSGLRDSFDYHVVIDDDISYPPDFVKVLVAACKHHGGEPVGCHTVKLREPFVSYYASRTTAHFSMAQPKPKEDVDILGTNSVCYEIRKLALHAHDFRIPNMADIWFAIAAKKSRLRLWPVARQKDWLKQQSGNWDESIYAASRRKDGSHLDTGLIQTTVVKENWSLWRS